MPKLRHNRRYYRVPINNVTLSENVCFEAVDSSTLRIPAQFLLKGGIPRDPQPQTARLGNQFLQYNRGVLNDLRIVAELLYDGNFIEISFKTSTTIGAIPLISPTTGKPDYGLVIKPRFDWSGLGPMLAQMGWRVIPTPLALPSLPRSDRKIPPWVLSTIILFRIKELLEKLERRFEICDDDRNAPHGSVKWPVYATARIPKCQFLKVPCIYPDLRDDRDLKGAIHFVLKKHLASLLGQRSAGFAVLQLIALCQYLLEKVINVPAIYPNAKAFMLWSKKPMQTEIFRKGVQAIEWTVEERGLAGLSDLQGLPWIMSMESFFEAWIETIATVLVRYIGGTIKSGRKRETITALTWDPPYLGSQKYLLPDIVIEREKETIIIDAKYKEHLEELQATQWPLLDEDIRERHRNDLLQVLAYSTTYDSKRIVSCLIYPCRKATWISLKNRNRLFYQASIYAGTREVNLVMTTLPIDADITEVVIPLVEVFKGKR
jgi:hypothetical protein